MCAVTLVVLLRLAALCFIYPNSIMLTFCRTVVLFFIYLKLKRVLTGMVLGLLFNNKSDYDDYSSSTKTIDFNDVHNNSIHSNAAAIGKGLLQGSALCGIVLVSTAVWLAGSGLSSSSSRSSSPVTREKED